MQSERFHQKAYRNADRQKWLVWLIKHFVILIDSQQFCVTRRSAGLPHLMCTLLATEPIQMTNNNSSNRFQQTVQKLLNCRTLVDPELE